MNLYSIASVARALEVSEQQVLSFVAAGTIPAPSIVGGLCRWRETDLASWSAAGFPASTPPAVKPMCWLRLALWKEDAARGVARAQAEELLDEKE